MQKWIIILVKGDSSTESNFYDILKENELLEETDHLSVPAVPL